jgi:tripartite-type tricarboxylate transporter receptor subunit TctC
MPKGTPREIVDKWQREVAKFVGSPEGAEKLAALGFVPVGNTPDEFARRIDIELKKWGNVIREAKIPQIQ